MKKFICLLFVLCLFFTLFGCKNNIDYSMYVSEVIDNYYEAENDNYKLTLQNTVKEYPYALDGYVNELNNIMVFKLESKKESLDSIVISFCINGKNYSENFAYNPVDGKMVANVKVQDFQAEPTFTVIIRIDDIDEDVILQSKLLDTTIPYIESVDSVVNYDDSISKMLQSNNIKCEIHIKLICDDNKNYYYVGIIDKTSKTYAYLIDGKSGKVLASKKIE